MALTMVHLLVADLWAAGHPEYRESPEFYYGAVSPDAIHIRDGDDKSHKDEIHLGNWGSPHPDRVIAYWRERSAPFDVGYGVHVLTDAQWVPRFRQRLPGIILPDGRLNTVIYYNDTFVTDFRLFHETPRLGAIMAMIERAATPTDHPLLTEYELTQWRDAILRIYRGECPKHDPPTYIDAEYVRSFVRDSIALIEETYAEA